MAHQGGKKEIKFGTDGWRAVIADQFTFENVAIVTHAVAKYVLNKFGQDRPIVIGHDTRFMADRFAKLSADILEGIGFDVLLVEQYTPTPLVAFAAREYGSAGAMMFTASHNPPQYLGIKFIPDYAGPATPDITDEIVAHTHEYQQGGLPDLATGRRGSIEYFNPYGRYVEFLSKNVDFEAIKKNPPKILYDSMFGAGLGYLDRIYNEKTGHRMDMIHDFHDPGFGGELPEPKDEYLPELMAQVPQGGYDLGLANDGDADRFGIIDENGRYLGANQILPLLLRYLYHRRGYRGAVVRTVATSMLIDALAEKLGVKVHETPVGFKHVGEIMRREDIIVGGEESGGLSILGHIPEKDGILGDLLIAEMVAVEGKPLSRIYDDLLDEAGVRLHGMSINLHLEDDRKKALMDSMRTLKPGDTFAGRPIQGINTADGVKLLFAQSDWLLLRPSGTEPILRLYGESPDEKNIALFRKAVEERMHAPTA